MPKYCPENERVKRDFAFFLQAASGKQDATIDAALRAIERFENSTGRKPFSKFHVEQARSFRAGIVDQMGRDGRPLSAATITTILKHLRNFFLWLSREPGFRSKLSANDANYFTPSDQDRRIAGARREGPVPSLKEVVQVLRAMPGNTLIEKRNRAVIAFAILTGARDGALASFRLKHINLTAGTVFQDGREVNTKRRKTYVTHFFQPERPFRSRGPRRPRRRRRSWSRSPQISTSPTSAQLPRSS
jgi:integrase